MDIQTNVFKQTLPRRTGVSPEILHFSVTGKISVRRDRGYIFTSNFLLSCVQCRTLTQTEFWKESKKSLPITMPLYWLFTIRALLMEAKKATSFFVMP